MEPRTDELAGMPVRWRSAPGPDGAVPVLYLHDAPAAGGAWAPLLERTGGVAPDLPGFGGTGKGGHFAYDFPGYAAWLETFAAHAGLTGSFDLVVHGFGAVGVPWALAEPGRVRRLVLVAPVPLTDEFRWLGLARLWRRRVVGESVIGFGFRPVFDRVLRRLHGGPLPQAFLDACWADFDPGTQRAILRLHRAASPDALERAGRGLSQFRGEALIAWGGSDGCLDPGWAEAIAGRLARGEAEVVPGAGHWAWIDDARVVDRIAGHLI